MRNKRAGLTVAAGLAGAVAAMGLAQAPAALAATAQPAPVSVEVCGQGGAVTRPASMILTCADDGEQAESLHWTSWTADGATATGLVAWRACTADCARDTVWHTAAAQFILSAPIAEPHAGRLFTKLTLHTTGATPAGFMRDLSFDETPVAAASPTNVNPAAPTEGQSSTTPTPGASANVVSPAAASGTLGYAQIEGFWIAAGGSSSTAETAAAITGAESSFIPGIIQQGVDYCGSGSDRAGWGLWQITCGNSVPDYGTDFQLLDPWNNAEAAVDKYDADVADGVNGFDPWSTYTSGAYKSYLTSATPATGLTDPGEYVQDGSTPSGTPSSPAADPGSTYGPPMSGSPSGPPVGIVYDNTLLTSGSWTGAKVSDGGGTVARTALLGLPNDSMDLFTLAAGDVWLNTLSDGSWSGAKLVDANGSITDMAAAVLTNGVVHLDTLTGGTVWDDSQNSNGSWTGAKLVDDNGSITEIALGATPGESMHLETLYKGTVYDNTLSSSGTWSGAKLIDNNGSITGISTAVPGGVLHLETLTGGTVWDNSLSSSGTWTGAKLIDNRGSITEIAAAGPADVLHVETLYRGTVYDDSLGSTGSWTSTLVDGNGAIFSIAVTGMPDGTMHLETIVP
jgi:hypothetical protein